MRILLILLLIGCSSCRVSKFIEKALELFIQEFEEIHIIEIDKLAPITVFASFLKVNRFSFRELDYTLNFEEEENEDEQKSLKTTVIFENPKGVVSLNDEYRHYLTLI